MGRRATYTQSPLPTDLSGVGGKCLVLSNAHISRLFPNGRVLYSQRLTIRAHCIMNLEDFPMDRQRCPLKIGSCKQTLIERNTSEFLIAYVPLLVGYTRSDLLYQWTAGRGVNIASDMKLSQFDLISTPTGTETTLRNRGTCRDMIISEN